MTFEQSIPLMTALISAVALLVGYGIQRYREREFELNKTRQDIYSRLIKNLSTRRKLLQHIEADPEWPKDTDAHMDRANELIDDKYPEYREVVTEGHELFTLVCIYCSDDAVKATAELAKYYLPPRIIKDKTVSEIALYLYALRETLFPNTSITPDDIRIIDWLR